MTKSQYKAKRLEDRAKVKSIVHRIKDKWVTVALRAYKRLKYKKAICHFFTLYCMQIY